MSKTPRSGWPFGTTTVLTRGGDGVEVRLRSLSRKDGVEWRRMRIEDEKFLRAVEPTVEGDWEDAHSSSQWRKTWGNLKGVAKEGTVVPAVIEVDGAFAGQLTLGNIQHGIVSSCWIGYWVHSKQTGQGVATAAVALGVDHAMKTLGLHRVEATVMEENASSRAVLKKAGFREEGFLKRNLHINGEWTDHHLVAVTREELFGEDSRGLVERMVHEGELIYVPPGKRKKS